MLTSQKSCYKTRVKYPFTHRRVRQIPSINIERFYKELREKNQLYSSGKKSIALMVLKQLYQSSSCTESTWPGWRRPGACRRTGTRSGHRPGWREGGSSSAAGAAQLPHPWAWAGQRTQQSWGFNKEEISSLSQWLKVEFSLLFNPSRW